MRSHLCRVRISIHSPVSFLPLSEMCRLALPVISFNQFEGPDIPDHDRAAAVLALWNHVFEFKIVERMILCRTGKPAYARFCWNAFRHSP